MTARPAIDDCWNRIGVRGDLSCTDLPQYVHCRNCPKYSAAASAVLNGELPAEHLARWSREVAQPKHIAELDTRSVVLFRVGGEWLALSAIFVREIADMRVIRSLPHRRDRAVLGVANIRGELLACLSIRHVLGIEEIGTDNVRRQGSRAARLIVLQRDGETAVCPVEEVHGIERFHDRDLREVPATVARAAATYTRSVLPWQGKSVGLLDEQMLFDTFNRRLALATST